MIYRSTKKRAIISSLLALIIAFSALFSLVGCNTPDEPPKTNTISAEGYDVTHISDLDKSDVEGNEKIKSWIEERDGYSLDRAYILSFVGEKDGKPYYSFIVYRKNADKKTTLELDVTEYVDENKTELNLHLKSGSDSTDGYELTYIGIPNAKETSLELFLDGDELDEMVTVTVADISPDTWN